MKEKDKLKEKEFKNCINNFGTLTRINATEYTLQLKERGIVHISSKTIDEKRTFYQVRISAPSGKMRKLEGEDFLTSVPVSSLIKPALDKKLSKCFVAEFVETKFISERWKELLLSFSLLADGENINRTIPVISDDQKSFIKREIEVFFKNNTNWQANQWDKDSFHISAKNYTTFQGNVILQFGGLPHLEAEVLNEREVVKNDFSVKEVSTFLLIMNNVPFVRGISSIDSTESFLEKGLYYISNIQGNEGVTLSEYLLQFFLDSLKKISAKQGQ